MTSGPRIAESFVARIWLERGPNGDPRWRGHIRHIQGEQAVYFQDLTEVCEFLERVSGIPGPGLTARPREDVAISESGAAATNKRKPSKKRRN